ncbi:MAG: DNA repair protein RecN [Ilumatobacteraceae bacterium]|nr:DNA repair protein RecN [Ilumatobacteraceae bacterium]
MLTELHLEGLGVIEQLDVVLGPGLTALTGETGAGKTMLVEAIELLVGGRADATTVRHGVAEARVDGRLIDLDGSERILSRVVPADGRSRAYVDGRPATAAELAGLASEAIDLHGQHQHQRLVSVDSQRGALDQFGNIDLAPLRAARARLTEIDAALAALGGDERARAREIDLLRFQVEELDAATIVGPDEDAALERIEETLADAVAHQAAGGAAVESIGGDGAARDALGRALAAIANRAPYSAEYERLSALIAELDDVTAVVRATAESIDDDPEQLAATRERRQLLADLRRKYGDDLAAVIEYHREAGERLAELERYDQRAAELDRQRSAAIAAERSAAERIGAERRAVAPQLAAAVQARLAELAMADAQLEIRVGRTDDDHPGDHVEFLLAANPGSPPQPLSKVASGGELARVMLALRLVLSIDGDEPPATLVFDEVDAGIGGAVAQSVADALSRLAQHHQVLVVTHLAQVAASADRHVVVTKRVANGQTYARADELDADERVDEIARMLSGAVSDSARTHARELLS